MPSPSPEQVAAAQHLLRLRKAQQSFQGFIALRHPTWKLPPFQQAMIHTLDMFEKRQLRAAKGGPICRNLLITMPPRHGKSTLSSVEFPAYFEARKPTRHTMSTSYNATLAADFGRQVRDIFIDPLVQQAFPHSTIAPDARAADVWRTTEGGNYFGIGLGGTTTGRPANLLNIDDPVKSREEAESPTMRKKVWDFYISGLDTRLQPEEGHIEGQIETLPLRIVTLTRWHPDDLAGRIMKTEEWKNGEWFHLNFPAITIKDSDVQIPRSALPPEDPDYLANISTVSAGKRYVTRGKEVALWEERFPLADLKRRQRLNPRDFESLYQQRPYIEGGNILKLDWWRHYPVDLNPSNFQALIITADTAFSKSATADYSVFCVMGLTHDGDIYLLDVRRGRWDFPELKQRLIALNSQYRGKGLRAVYIEDKASGQSLLQEMRRESGMAVIPYKVTKDKVSRVNAITPLIEGGRVHIPSEAPWLDDFLNEAVAFPAGEHDDQVDAFTMGVDVLSRQAITPEALFGSFDASNSLNQQVSRQTNRWSSSLSTSPTFRRWGE